MLRKTQAVKLQDGLASLAAWWRSGAEPVSGVEAARRSAICETCPLNEHESLFERATSIGANIIREGMEWKHDRKLHVANEEKLHICSACGCDLKLKVFAPIEIARLSPADYPKHCWIK